MATRTPYASDVSDEERTFVAPYLALLPAEAGQRRSALREVFNGLRSLVWAGAPWCGLPHDLPPWIIVYQQARRWLAAGTFAAIVAYLRTLLRLAEGRGSQRSSAPPRSSPGGHVAESNAEDRGRPTDVCDEG